MTVLPKSLKNRPDLNLRQGIKSSLSKWRNLIASLVVLYKANGGKANLVYGIEYSTAGKTRIKLSQALIAMIRAYWGCEFADAHFVQLENSALFKSQIEALQVGLGLFLKLAEVQFENNSLADSAERTGENRFSKVLKFTINAKIVDVALFENSARENIVDFLHCWLQNEPSKNDRLETSMMTLLTMFSEECQYKIRNEGKEVSFQEEGIYAEIIKGNVVQNADEKEPVGPFRLLKSYIKEGMHPFLHETREGFVSNGVGLSDYADHVTNWLNLKQRVLMTVVEEKSQTITMANLCHALATFRAFRATEGGVAFSNEVNGSVREYFDAGGEVECDGFAEFCMKHTWSGTNGRGWAQLSQLSDEEKSRCCNYFGELRRSETFTLAHFEKHAKRPHGIGPVFVSELLMKYHPDTFCYYNEIAHEALVKFDLAHGKYSSAYDAQKYARVYGAFSTILDKMREMEIPKTCEEDSGDADYLTVNEFIYFVSKHSELIEEEMMKKQLATITLRPEYGDKDLSGADPLMMRLMSALRTKPFAILAGHSGTGKSRMVRKLAYMTCCDEGLRKDAEGKWLDQPGNFCMIQVKPNWHDNSELLGYYSEMKGAYKTTDFVRFVCKAYAYPDVPFFVCLDEMNLAPVEHYFAEYLSAIESAKLEETGDRKVQITDPLVPKDKSLYDYPTDLGAETKQAVEWIAAHGLTIPKNLFVVGTVNMDETTCQFSRKVLDRAMTIEMAQVDFSSFGVKSAKPSFDDTLKCAEIAKLLDGEVDAEQLTDEQKRKLDALKDVLGKTPFMIAYRFANEYALYTKSLAEFNGGADDAAAAEEEAEAFDDMVLMKVLPRVAGERSVVEKIFGNEGEGLTRLVGEGSKSAFKMSEIIERGDNYLSFWP